MMDSKTIRETALAYLSVYDQDLREAMEYDGVIGKSDGMYDQVISHLLDEGYANSYESAEFMIDTMSEEWIDDIVETIISRGNIPAHLRGKPQADVRADAAAARARQVASAAGQKGYGDTVGSSPELTRIPDAETAAWLRKTKSPYGKRIMGKMGRESTPAGAGIADATSNDPGKPGSRNISRSRRMRPTGRTEVIRKPKTLSEEFDVYDVVLTHLLDEGYAETLESAEAIMVNMSEEWIDNILDEAIIRTNIPVGPGVKVGGTHLHDTRTGKSTMNGADVTSSRIPKSDLKQVDSRRNSKQIKSKYK